MNENLKWFTDAKYGLFVHWGLYSMLGGVWKGERAPHTSEWIMKNMKIPLSEYRPLMKDFCPTAFDARAYVKKAKEWGMRYVTVTAKHHDGFALYDSKVSDYTVMHTPYGKDIIRQFADACAEEGMTFCVYYSQMQDWEHPHGNGNTWDFDPKEQCFETYFYEKCVPQVKELLTEYGKIGMIWFDTPYDMPIELCRELAEVVKACHPDCLINGRIGYGLGDYRQMADNSIPNHAYFGAWEVPMTLNGSWGYSHFDTHWAEPAEVIARLSAVAGKGGNLLLNVGPDRNGVIPERSVEILDEVGEWLRRNGESVYGTSALPDFPYEIKWGNLTYRADGRRLYLHVKKYPRLTPRVSILGLRTRVKSARLLTTGEELRFTQTYEQARDEERFAVWIPAECPDPVDTVVVLELVGEPEAQRLDDGFYARP